jgi:Ca-activated chloride channel homolog
MIWLFLFVLLASYLTSAQVPQDGEFKITTEVDLVLLDVSVKDPKGGYIVDLTKDNFHVYENGALQKITEFVRSDIPVAVGLVMDNSGSMQRKRASLIDAGLAFIGASNPQDQIFVVNFDDQVQLGLPKSVPFTDNINLLRSALSKDMPQGRTALYDAVAVALKHLETGQRGKKALVVVSDGGDNFSRRKFQDVMQLIQESPATVYTVGIYDRDDPDRNPHVLKRIAGVSGGECFLPGELKQIIPIFTKIASDIRNRYTIGYTPVRSSDKAALRKIHVVASAAGHDRPIVRTRTSYLLPERMEPKSNTPESQK